jgi:hypothetical protein
LLGSHLPARLAVLVAAPARVAVQRARFAQHQHRGEDVRQRAVLSRGGHRATALIPSATSSASVQSAHSDACPRCGSVGTPHVGQRDDEDKFLS